MKRWVTLALAAALLGGVGVVTTLPGSEAWLSTVSGGRGHSMSHGPSPQPGVLDDGDLGNYQRRPDAADITTMVAARAQGLAPVAGDHGDVLVYRANGQPPGSPGVPSLVEHRALVWAAYDQATGLFDVPELGLEDAHAVTIPQVGGWDADAGAYLHRDVTLVLAERTADGALRYPAGQHSGWVTKGDHNRALDQEPGADAVALSALVQPAWVEAKLTRVVDQDHVVRDVVVGTVVAVLVGVAYFLAKRLWRGPAPRPRLPLKSDDPFAPVPKQRRLPSARNVMAMVRAACDACGTPWAELAFCARCGAERAPKNRYATREAREAALRGARRR